MTSSKPLRRSAQKISKSAPKTDKPPCAACGGSGYVSYDKPCYPCWEEVGECPPSPYDDENDSPLRDWGDL